MSKEIMQRALDALETIPAGGADLNQLAFTVAGVTLALRAALAEPAAPQGEPVAWLYQHGETGRTRIVMPDQVFTNGPNQWLMVGPLYQHPPAPLQPVAWLDEATDCAYTRAELDGGSEQGMRPLYAAPPAAPSVPASQWIACSEQLPDDDIEVLVWNGHCVIASRAGEWFVTDECATVEGVTAWMDLPGEPEC